MKRSIRLLPEARAEFDSAADWYEQRRASLGIEFVDRVRESFQQIADHPEMKAVIYRDVRQFAVKQFPYVVVYRYDDSEILVIAIFHTARDPEAWASRV